MKTAACLVLLLAAGLPQTSVQVDVIPPAGRRITVEQIAPYTIVLTNVPTVLFDDGTMLGDDRYHLVATITARTELSLPLVAAEAMWKAKTPDVYEFTYKQFASAFRRRPVSQDRSLLCFGC